MLPVLVDERCMKYAIEIRLNIPYFKNNCTAFGMKQHRVALVEDNSDDQQTRLVFDVDVVDYLVVFRLLNGLKKGA
jgi:hypothetical protein